jgi:hypothetical protein
MSIEHQGLEIVANELPRYAQVVVIGAGNLGSSVARKVREVLDS